MRETTLTTLDPRFRRLRVIGTGLRRPHPHEPTRGYATLVDEHGGRFDFECSAEEVEIINRRAIDTNRCVTFMMTMEDS